MFTAHCQVGSTLRAMLVTGIILAPAVMATPAVQDLIDLRTVINSAANTIGDLHNPNRGWGLFSSSGPMGTADLINNVTTTILRSKFQVDTNKVLNPCLTTTSVTDVNADSLAQPSEYDQYHCTVDTDSSDQLQHGPPLHASNDCSQSRKHHYRSLDTIH